MANQRHPDKRPISGWLFESDLNMIRSRAKRFGYKCLTDWLAAIAEDERRFQGRNVVREWKPKSKSA
jgi:hypothetical protein